jgi:peptide/nickel transport system ATP-binding protein
MRHDGQRPGDPLLSVSDLRTHVHADRGTVRAVDGVSFDVHRGEAVCLVGESGSGKSVTCESLTSIVPQPPAEIVDGSITFDGIDLRAAGTDQSAIRGARIGHVFQNPQHALDPVYSVGDQLIEATTVHGDVDEAPARDRAVDLLGQVGIPRPAQRIDDYPHQFSGGMAQRVAVAIALAAEPDLLIADEPTTAVDVTVQARLLDLFRDLLDGGMALLLVTHDLRVVAALADRVLVMFGGTIVERGPVEAVFDRPAHPYTQALFDSYDGTTRLPDRPSRGELPADGCRFREECPHAVEDCAGGDQPAFHAVGDQQEDGPDRADHAVSCVYYGDGHNAEALRSASRAVSEGTTGDDDD